jgi:photosystem II stability/assembly factor-like uncharacterized protein
MDRVPFQRLLAPLSIAALLALSLPPAAQAQAQKPASSDAGADEQTRGDPFLAGLRWRNIGPNRGGRSIAVAGSADRPLEYYFGATGGGLWKTTDGGTTWKPVSDKGFETSSVGALAVAPSNPDVLYVGMGETQLRGDIIQGDGVYKSTDAGKTWTHVGLAATQAIARIRVNPRNPDLVYVAALGDPYRPNADRGIFRSTNGGKSWDKVLFRDEKTGAVDLALDPNNSNVLYAALWEAFRTPYSLSSGGPGSGLFKSTDGGSTWTEITRHAGLPAGVLGAIGVSVSGADSSCVYAIVEAQEGGVFVSDDAGGSWHRINEERRLRQRAFYYTRIYADPKVKDTVYVLNTGCYRSVDGGKTYKPIHVPHGDNHDLWIAPNDPKRMIESNDGGANVSVNAGESWTNQAYPTAQFYNVFPTNHVPYHVCGAQQDNSTACIPVSGGGPFYAVGGGESGYIAPHPTKLDVYFAGSYGGLLTRFDRATGESRSVNIWPDNPMGYSAKDIKERFQWTYPIVFSSLDPTVLYASSQHLWRSRDEGQSWERISPDLTRADPATLGPSGGPITLDQTGVETYATIFTIAPSRHEMDVIWTGSDDGVVQITRDGGKSWTNITPPDLPPFTRISLIEASPHDKATAFMVGNRYQLGDRSPYVYRTSDYGKSWTKIVNGIPADDFVHAVREDPVRQGLLFLGTEKTLYMSSDNGASWRSLRLNLPITPVHGIAIKDNDLLIGTHGRSFYIMENISVLRQLRPEMTTARLHLFAPPAVMRRVQPTASIDYYLKSAVDKVTIQILDSAGHEVRTFESVPEKGKKEESAEQKPGTSRQETAESQTKASEKAPEEATAKAARGATAKAAGKAAPKKEDTTQKEETVGAEEEDEDNPFRPPAPKVTTKAGMNRFQWDMRYKSARDFPKMIFWAGNVRGPLALPGAYQAKLTAGGETQTQPLTILKDPRATAVSDADLQQQFTLALQVRDKVTQANEAVLRIRHLKEQAKERADKAKDAKLTAAADAFSTKLTAIEGEIYQYRNQSSQDPLNFPIKLNNKLAALKGVVESADGKPTKSSYEVFDDLSARLATQLSALDACVKTDLAPLNRLVTAKKLTAIKDEVPPPPNPAPAPTASQAERLGTQAERLWE